MYSGSGGDSRTGSPPVVQFVGLQGRVRLTPQDEKVLPMDDIQLFRKIQLIITNYRTQFSHTDVYKYCVIISRLPIHQLVATFSSYFIEIEWWQSFHYIYQLHCIWQSLVFEFLRIYFHHGTHFCVLSVKRHCLPFTRLPHFAGGAPAVNHKATEIWLVLRVLTGNEHCNVCDGNLVSEYIFNIPMTAFEWMHPRYECRI